MAIGSSHSFDVSQTWEQREAHNRHEEMIVGFVNRMEKGERLTKYPWDDRTFQEVIILRLASMMPLRLAAEKLAVIKEVFGGKS